MFYYFNAEMKYYEKPPTLNEATWDYIQQAAQNGTASDLWSVGDRKEITLNGTCRARTFNNYKVYAYILGFNHNAALEGDNTIHFQIGANALANGLYIALTDWTDSQKHGGYTGTRFCMNDAATNVGGWKDSLMRTIIIPEFISCLPSDLQDVLKTVTKYTDNVGNGSGSVESNVTATQDKVFLLSNYEKAGGNGKANTYEQSKQAQYDFHKTSYMLGYNDQTLNDRVNTWYRSPRADKTNRFCYFELESNVDANYSQGFAPAFVVG